MMNYIIRVILECSISESCISEDDLEIYSFGLECMFLKLLHYISYLIIGIALDSLLSLFVSACILMPLRTKAGGYHANTRIGCYFFSCIMVIVLLMLGNAIFCVLMWNEIEIYKYLASGIAMAAMLLLLGKGKEWLAGIRIEVKT